MTSRRRSGGHDTAGRSGGTASTNTRRYPSCDWPCVSNSGSTCSPPASFATVSCAHRGGWPSSGRCTRCRRGTPRRSFRSGRAASSGTSPSHRAHGGSSAAASGSLSRTACTSSPNRGSVTGSIWRCASSRCRGSRRPTPGTGIYCYAVRSGGWLSNGGCCGGCTIFGTCCRRTTSPRCHASTTRCTTRVKCRPSNGATRSHTSRSTSSVPSRVGFGSLSRYVFWRKHAFTVRVRWSPWGYAYSGCWTRSCVAHTGC